MYKRITHQRGTHVVSGLKRTYETILGEKKRLDDSEYGWEGVEGYHLALDYWKQAAATLDHLLLAIETTIRLFEPSWDRSKMRARVRHLSAKLVPEPAGIVASMFRVLRAALSPMTVAEIALGVAQDRKLKTSRRDQRQRLYVAVYNALKRYEAKEIVKSIGGKPAKWALAEKLDEAA